MLVAAGAWGVLFTQRIWVDGKEGALAGPPPGFQRLGLLGGLLEKLLELAPDELGDRAVLVGGKDP